MFCIEEEEEKKHYKKMSRERIGEGEREEEGEGGREGGREVPIHIVGVLANSFQREKSGKRKKFKYLKKELFIQGNVFGL